MKMILLSMVMLLGSVSSMAQKTFDKCVVGYSYGQKAICVEGDNGISVVVSKKDDNKVLKHQELHVVVVNNGQSTFNFDPTKIIVEATNKGKVESCAVYTCDEWVKKEKTRILLWGPNNTETQTVKTEVSSSNGQNTTIETKANIRTGANDEARAEAEANINAKYFKRVTILARQTQQGMIVAKNPKAQNMIVKVPVNGNTYVFDFSKE